MAPSLIGQRAFIYKVLKTIHPDTGISQAAMEEVQMLYFYIIDRIMQRATKVVRSRGVITISARDVQLGVMLAFPGELRKHAVRTSSGAVEKFTMSRETPNENKRMTQSGRAGLLLSVARVFNKMKDDSGLRVSPEAAVYLTAAAEYAISEILELAGNASRDDKRARVMPRHLLLAIGNDIELSKLFDTAVLDGGVLPNIDARLIK